MCLSYFFFNDTATTEIYTLSLHDALPIFFLWHAGSFSLGRVACSGFSLAVEWAPGRMGSVVCGTWAL